MSVKVYKAISTTTLNELYPSQSFHRDETFQVGKIISSSLITGKYLKRGLIKFPNGIESQYSNYPIAWLKVFTAHAEALPVTSSLEVGFNSSSADVYYIGRGRRDSNPQVKEGATFGHQDQTSLLAWTNQTSSNRTSITFDYGRSTDVDLNVSTLWSASAGHTGRLRFVNVNLSSSVEANATRQGTIEYYGADTHTIYQPALFLFTSSVSYVTSSAGSLLDVTNDYVVYHKNLQTSYRSGSSPVFRFGARELYPAASYATTSVADTVNYLPSSSYYNFKDVGSGELLLPWQMKEYLRLSANASGHYIDALDTDLFYPYRKYQVVLQVVSGSQTDLIELPETFEIEE